MIVAQTPHHQRAVRAYAKFVRTRPAPTWLAGSTITPDEARTSGGSFRPPRRFCENSGSLGLRIAITQFPRHKLPRNTIKSVRRYGITTEEKRGGLLTVNRPIVPAAHHRAIWQRTRFCTDHVRQFLEKARSLTFYLLMFD